MEGVSLSKRKTTEEFKKEVYELVGNEFEVIEDYVSSRTKIKMRHNKCGNIIEIEPNSFLNGNRCSYCGHRHSYTTEEFKKKIYNAVGNEFELLSDYYNSSTKIKLKHNKCGNTIEIYPYTFLKFRSCAYCTHRHKYTPEEFRNKVYELVKDEYAVFGDYVNYKTKIKFKHDKCGKIFEMRPHNFLSGVRCPYCRKRKLSNDEFKDRVYDLVKDEYTVVGRYVNSSEKIKMLHNKCNNSFDVRPFNFVQGTRCPYCAPNHKYTPEEFRKKIYNLVGDEYEVLDDYVDSKTKLRFKCNKCKGIVYTLPINFVYGRRRHGCNYGK